MQKKHHFSEVERSVLKENDTVSSILSDLLHHMNKICYYPWMNKNDEIENNPVVVELFEKTKKAVTGYSYSYNCVCGK